MDTKGMDPEVWSRKWREAKGGRSRCAQPGYLTDMRGVPQNGTL
jgi:hypothetical protein